MLRVCEAEIPCQPSGATLNSLPLKAWVLPTAALLAGTEDEVLKLNWLPRTIHGAAGAGSAAALALTWLPEFDGLVVVGVRPDAGDSVTTLGALSVPEFGSIAWTWLHSFSTGLQAFLEAPKGIENEMMYQSTPTVPPVGGPHTSRLQPSSTVVVKLVNERSDFVGRADRNAELRVEPEGIPLHDDVGVGVEPGLQVSRLISGVQLAAHHQRRGRKREVGAARDRDRRVKRPVEANLGNLRIVRRRREPRVVAAEGQHEVARVRAMPIPDEERKAPGEHARLVE